MCRTHALVASTTKPAAPWVVCGSVRHMLLLTRWYCLHLTVSGFVVISVHTQSVFPCSGQNQAPAHDNGRPHVRRPAVWQVSAILVPNAASSELSSTTLAPHFVFGLQHAGCGLMRRYAVCRLPDDRLECMGCALNFSIHFTRLFLESIFIDRTSPKDTAS